MPAHAPPVAPATGDLGAVTSPEQLDAAWLSAVAGPPGSRLVSFSIEPFPPGVGLVAQVQRLRLEWEGDGPASLVVKSASPFPGARSVGRTLGMYEREVAFYRDLSAALAPASPACRYAGSDAGTGEFLLLIDDLTGVRVVDQIEGAGEADAVAAVEFLATLHGRTWGGGGAAAGVPTLDAPWFVTAIAAAFGQCWGPACERFCDRIPAAVQRLGPGLVRAMPALMARLSRGPLSLGHGDLRCDNLFFPDDDGVVAIDWQLVARGSPVRDLAYFLTQSAPAAERPIWEAELVGRYVDLLAQHGATGYGVAEAWEDYRLAAAYHLCYPVIAAGALDDGGERGGHLLARMIERSATAIDELGCAALIEAL